MKQQKPRLIKMQAWINFDLTIISVWSFEKRCIWCLNGKPESWCARQPSLRQAAVWSGHQIQGYVCMVCGWYSTVVFIKSSLDITQLGNSCLCCDQFVTKKDLEREKHTESSTFFPWLEQNGNSRREWGTKHVFWNVDCGTFLALKSMVKWSKLFDNHKKTYRIAWLYNGSWHEHHLYPNRIEKKYFAHKISMTSCKIVLDNAFYSLKRNEKFMSNQPPIRCPYMESFELTFEALVTFY